MRIDPTKQLVLKAWLLNRNCPKHIWARLTELENGDIECLECLGEEVKENERN